MGEDACRRHDLKGTMRQDFACLTSSTPGKFHSCNWLGVDVPRSPTREVRADERRVVRHGRAESDKYCVLGE